MPLDPAWTYLMNGDLIGFLTYIYVSRIGSVFYGILVMIPTLSILLRTHSLTLVSILWILIGSTFITLMPLVAPIAYCFLGLGVGGLLYQLYRGRG